MPETKTPARPCATAHLLRAARSDRRHAGRALGARLRAYGIRAGDRCDNSFRDWTHAKARYKKRNLRVLDVTKHVRTRNFSLRRPPSLRASTIKSIARLLAGRDALPEALELITFETRLALMSAHVEHALRQHVAEGVRREWERAFVAMYALTRRALRATATADEARAQAAHGFMLRARFAPDVAPRAGPERSPASSMTRSSSQGTRGSSLRTTSSRRQLSSPSTWARSSSPAGYSITCPTPPAKRVRWPWRAHGYCTPQIRGAAAVSVLEGLVVAVPADPDVSTACIAALTEMGAVKRAAAVARATRRNGLLADPRRRG